MVSGKSQNKEIEQNVWWLKMAKFQRFQKKTKETIYPKSMQDEKSQNSVKTESSEVIKRRQYSDHGDALLLEVPSKV